MPIDNVYTVLYFPRIEKLVEECNGKLDEKFDASGFGISLTFDVRNGSTCVIEELYPSGNEDEQLTNLGQAGVYYRFKTKEEATKFRLAK